MKRRAVFFSCLFFILGVGIASFLPERLIRFNFGIFVCFAVGLILTFVFYPRKFFVYALWASFLFFGIWRFFIGIPENTPDKIWFYNGKEAVFWGAVAAEPEYSTKNQKLKIKSFWVGNFDRKIKGNILVFTDLYSEYKYGDILEIKGELTTPEKFEDFAYDKYLARYDIYSICYSPEIRLLKESDLGREEFFSKKKLFLPVWFYGNIFVLKKKIRETINIGLPEPEAGLARAMVLGYKSGVPERIRDNFSYAGLSHILAISGLHIGIIIAIIFNFILFLGAERKYAFYFTVIWLIFYVILIGVPASAARAGIMGFLVLFALHSGRLNRLDYALAITAAIFCFINPKQLMADIGFQLSFLAVLGIAWFYPIFSQKILLFFKEEKNRAGKIIFNSFAVTLSAQIFTLPIIACNFKIISLISPLSNLLVLWALPFILISIFIGLFLSSVFFPFAVFFFLPATLLIKYVILISGLLVRIPFAYFIFK